MSVQTLVRYGYVPFMLFGLIGTAVYIVVNGHSYAWLLPLLGIAFASAFAAERVLPYHEEWNHSHGDDATNIWHTIVYEGSSITGVLMIPVVAWVFSIQPDGPQHIWPREWPIVAQFILALVVADFMFTIIHYFSHRYAWLWRLHAVHHGVSRLYGFNGLARHPVHQAIDMIIGTAPMAFAGMPVEVAVLLGFAVSVQLIVQHSNVDAALGPLRNHLSIGRIHHLHHVNWGKEGDVNFGLFLTVWDRMLGTFVPEPPRPITARDMGIDEVPDFPKRYRDQLAFPFVYKPGNGQPPKQDTGPVEAEAEPSQNSPRRAYNEAAE